MNNSTRYRRRSRRNTRSVAVDRNQVRQMVRSMTMATTEVKRYSQVIASYATGATGTVTPLTQGLLVGDTISGRTGIVIKPLVLELNLSIIAPSTMTEAIFTRIIIFQDMQNTGVTPTVANVLDGGTPTSTYTVQPAQQGRFKILMDRTFSTTPTAENAAVMKEFRFKLKGLIYYNGDTNAAGSNGPGSLWMLNISNSTVGTTANLSFYSSVTYTDA